MIRSFLKYAALLAVVLMGTLGWAEAAAGDRVAYKLGDPSRPANVKAHLLNGSITVKGYEGSEVIVEAHARGSDKSENESGGLHRIPQTSTGLSVDADSNDVVVRVDAIQRTVDLTISVPRRSSLSLHTVNDGNITVSDVDGEMDINDINGHVSMSHVGGSAVVHALNGRVQVTFNRVDPQKSMAFSSMNGDIDVTFPPDLKANLSLRTDNGEIFSDFDIQVPPTPPQQTVEDDRSKGGHYRVRIEKTVHATVNGGGPEIQFKDFNGNIYIRKSGK